MQKNRLEAFSDGVIAIIITIMVLELKVPHSPDWYALLHLWPQFLSYLLSFVYIAIYWNNHHHMLHTVTHVNGLTLWANMHLLFWLSLVPFGTAWMGENGFTELPTVLYAVVLLMSAIAYYLLERAIIHTQGPLSTLARALSIGQHSRLGRLLGLDVKGKISLVLYFLSIGVAFLSPLAANLIFALVALMWIVPDRRIEKTLEKLE